MTQTKATHNIQSRYNTGIRELNLTKTIYKHNTILINFSTVQSGIRMIMAAICNRACHYILSCGFFFLSSSCFFFAYSQPSQIRCLPYFHTWCGPSANLGCRSETCCMRLAGNAGRKKSPKIAICPPSHSFVGTHLRN